MHLPFMNKRQNKILRVAKSPIIISKIRRRREKLKGIS